MRNYPIHIEWELTNHCNISCIMCPNSIMVRDKGFMDYGLFKRTVDESQGHTKTSYLHQIGEPLLHDKIIKFINYAEEAGIKTSLSTNCMSLDELMSEKILNSLLSEITLCLDSTDTGTYEHIRKGGNMNTVLKNITYFLSRKKDKPIHVQLQMIKMPENKDEWEEFKKIKFNGINEVLVKEYSTFAGAVGKSDNPRRFKCNKLNTHLTIQWNGDIVPCCRDYDGIEVMGNVKNNSIYDIWHSDKYNKFRNNFKQTELCRDC